MPLPCKRLEHCHWCPPRAPRTRCWWIIGDRGPWRLCESCLAYATEQAGAS